GQLVVETALLERNAETLPQLPLVGPPVASENGHVTRIGAVQTPENLYRRRLSGPVWPQQSEALAVAHGQVQAVHRLHRAVSPGQAAALDRERARHAVHGDRDSLTTNRRKAGAGIATRRSPAASRGCSRC